MRLGYGSDFAGDAGREHILSALKIYAVGRGPNKARRRGSLLIDLLLGNLCRHFDTSADPEFGAS